MSVVRHVRRALDHAARGLGVLAAFERRMRAQPTVLMYHRVLPDARCASYPFPALVMPVSMFERQVAWLAANATVAPLRDLWRAFVERQCAPRPLVALTFDDGYDDNAAIAAPVLERHGVRGTFFVTTGFVGDRQAMWYDRAALALAAAGDDTVRDVLAGLAMPAPAAAELAADRVGAWVEALKRAAPDVRREAVERLAGAASAAAGDGYRAMTPDDVRRLAATGHEVGAHSVGHEILPALDDGALAHELEHSRARVAAWSGRPVDGFCYPNGSVDDRVAAATARAGYAYACTTAPPRRATDADPWRLPRIDVTQRRVTAPKGAFDLVAFRAEISLLHEVWR